MKTGRSGRGPTKLMSPSSTLNTWGISSMRVLRMKLPTRVTRSSFGLAHTAPFFSASVRMLRNFQSR